MAPVTRRTAAALAGGGLLALVVGLIWAGRPAHTDRAGIDPAVAHLNAPGRMAGALSEGWFGHSGLRLHYVEAGTGPTIVLLHGFPSYWLSFARQVEMLAKAHHVVAIDGLGAGRSDAPVAIAPYRLAAMAAQIMALVDHLDAPAIHLVGHDWGAALAFGIAQNYPDRIKSVTGLGAPPLPIMLDGLRSDPAVQRQAAYVETLKRVGPLPNLAMRSGRRIWTGAYQPMVQRGELTAAEGALFRAATADPRRTAAHVNWYRANIPAPDRIGDTDYWPARQVVLPMPAQLIWGDRDRAFAPAYAAKAAALGGKMQVVRLPGVGHWPHIERAGIVNAAIASIVSRAEAQPAA